MALKRMRRPFTGCSNGEDRIEQATALQYPDIIQLDGYTQAGALKRQP
jgi:hypothetical protein